MKTTVASRFFLLVFVLLTLTTACNVLRGSNARVLGSDSETPLVGDAWVTCSSACRDRAQCGLAQNINTDVIMLRTDFPDTVEHNMIIGTGEPVVIMQSADVEVARLVDPNSRYVTRFYQVQVPNRAPAWVAGWCVEQ